MRSVAGACQAGRERAGEPNARAPARTASLRLSISKGTSPNMFDFGPPFQIDANLGGPAGITEMLVQSTENEISALPALPRQWLNGSLSGARLRGGGKLDIAWREGRLIEVKLQSDTSCNQNLQ